MRSCLLLLLTIAAAVSRPIPQFDPWKETFQHPTFGETYCHKFCYVTNGKYRNGKSYCWKKCRGFMIYYEGEKAGSGVDRETFHTTEVSLPPTPPALTHDSTNKDWLYIVAAAGSIVAGSIFLVVLALKLYGRSKSISRQHSVVVVQEMRSQLNNQQAPPRDREALLSVVVDTEHVVVDDTVDMEPAVALEVPQVLETPMKSPTLQQPANGEEMPSGKPLDMTEEDDTTPPDSMNLLTVTGKPRVTEKPD